MNRRTVIAVSLSASVASGLFFFQNCAPSGGSAVNIASIKYVEMSSSQAQSMMAPYEGTCASSASAQASAPTVPANGAVTVSGSNTVGKGTLVSQVSGMGNYTFFGTAAGARISDVNGLQGNLNVCDASVNAVRSTANILVDGGTVLQVLGGVGNLYLIDADYPEVINQFAGNIVVKIGGVYKGRSYSGQ